MNIKVGADPELFVSKGDALVSAHNLVPGTKDVPHKVNDGAVQVDGMALEFNINPAEDETVFVANLQSVLGQLKAMVPEYNFEIIPVAEFGEAYIKSQPKEARELGCSVDYNAYTGMPNERPCEDAPFRTAAGHVHIGWSEDENISSPMHVANCEAVVKELDVFLGLASLFYDDNTKRRDLYGKAGAYRPKTYGVEYRVLSNKWLASDKLMAWVFRSVKAAIAQLESGSPLHFKYDNVEEIINTSDKKKAKAILDAEGISLPEM